MYECEEIDTYRKYKDRVDLHVNIKTVVIFPDILIPIYTTIHYRYLDTTQILPIQTALPNMNRYEEE